jgi:hypothetical protein
VAGWGSYSYAFGPVVAVVVLGVLVLVLRWAFRRGQSVVATDGRPGPPTDYGVLVPVAHPHSADEGRAIAAFLQRQGIACTVAHTTAGLRVLVWPTQSARAGEVLRSRGAAQ